MTLSKSRRALLVRLRHRKHREKAACFMVEGVRAARAALVAATPIRFAVVSPRLAALDSDGSVNEMLGRGRFDVIAVDDRDLQSISATVTPQGVLLVCDEPGHSLAAIDLARGGVLVADAVQDPANLGAMVRAAAAFGLAGVVALKGTVDPWNAKVVRGSAGASFRLPIVRCDTDDFLEWAERQKCRILAADIDGNDVRGADRTLPWALVIGNEGSGLRRRLRRAAGETLTVPVELDSDSLNAGVAAAVMCYELSRRTP